MGILNGIAKIALSPVRGVAEVFSDVSGNNGEENQGLSILTVGLSSVVKGTFKGIEKGVEEIYEDE